MLRESQHLFKVPKVQTDENHDPKNPKQRCCTEHHLFYLQLLLLLIPLTLSVLLLYSVANNWILPGNLYNMVNKWRTSVQTAVQVISAVLAAIEVFTLCRLINLTTRIRFTKSPVSLNTLGFWSALSTLTVDWSYPIWMIIATLLVSNLHTVFSAVWTGALTPMDTMSTENTTIRIPDWSNITLIKEYPSQIDSSGPSVRNTNGYFTYSVGMGLLGSLLASANSASTVDGSIRNHHKLDNTQYNYFGRSYGAGSSAGLDDGTVLKIAHAVNYTYSEVALASSVSCIYNRTSGFTLSSESGENSWPAEGSLPDSTGGEYSNYIGYSTKAIVAIGVASKPINWTTPTRYMAIAAGEAYDYLNKVQCAVKFTPARFNVSVDIINRNITVCRLAGKVSNIDPHGNMTHTVIRQLELISNDQTSFYRSTVGDAFKASISDYQTFIKSNSTSSHRVPESHIVLKGVGNAIISYIDDILVAYASAQLQVGHLTNPTLTVVYVDALRVGSRGYIVASLCITVTIILLVIAEAVRMRGWMALPVFDYMDVQMLVMSASRGGNRIAEYTERKRAKDLGHIPIMWCGEALDDVGLILIGIDN